MQLCCFFSRLLAAPPRRARWCSVRAPPAARAWGLLPAGARVCGALCALYAARGASQPRPTAHCRFADLARARLLRAEPAAAALRQTSSQAGAVAVDTSYVLDSSLRGDRAAASSFLLSAVRRVHAAATKRQL
jgi:hypothetical protein